MDAGPGDDLCMGGGGNHFINGGANDNEELRRAGQRLRRPSPVTAPIAPFGGGGDDWMEFGTGQDIGAGDDEASVFDDPVEPRSPGNDVMIGQPGENDYDAEGGGTT